ncbi:retrotransposable element Tf2 [Tanacetum coccineum]
MVVSTRNNIGTPNGTPLVLDDETMRFLVETLTGLVQGSLATVQTQMESMANDITALSLQNNQVVNRGPQLNHSRMAKIEFPKFFGDDVKGWVFKSLLWHSQFVRIHGTNVSWEVYKKAILARFGNVYGDPMSELKNLKYETTTREYEDAFDSLLSRVEINEDHAVSLFMRGLPTEIEMGVGMFKPKTLADAYCLTNLQEATLNAVKKKGRSAFVSNSSRYNNSPINTFQKPLLTNPTTNVTAKPNTPVAVQNRRLSQKEYVEKRANNLCFYYDQKYVPGHKCSGQLYSLVLMPEYEIEGEFLEEDEIIGDNGLVDLQAPLISHNALTGANNFKTLRVTGVLGKNTIHILIDCRPTHNFLDKNKAKQLGCHIRNTCLLSVTVADGNKLVTTSECKQFKWQFGTNFFTTDVMLLPLGGCDMVLGIQWLATLGDIRFNFHELRMDFKYNNKRVLLRGTHKSNLEWLSTKVSNKTARQAELHSMAMCVFPHSASTCMQIEETTTNVHPALQQVIKEYEDVFSIPKELPPKRDHDHKIPLIEGAQPVNIRPYRHPPTQKDAIKEMVIELLQTGVI